MNDLEAIKTAIEKFINKYNITEMCIDIEEIEPTVCAVGDERKPYKEVSISIEF